MAEKMELSSHGINAKDKVQQICREFRTKRLISHESKVPLTNLPHRVQSIIKEMLSEH